MASDKYLKFSSGEMLDYLKSTLTTGGVYTDQNYPGSNLSIILETLAALYEGYTYNLNYTASEASFDQVSVYTNMLKIVNALGYKARVTVAPTILGTLKARIYLDKVLPQLSITMETVNDIILAIQDALQTVTSPKIVSKNLSFTPTSSEYSLAENVQVFPEFINLTEDNVLYYVNNNYVDSATGILAYLKYIWNISDDTTVNGTTTLTELATVLGYDNTASMIAELKTYAGAIPYVDANLNVSSKPADNYITAINGKWYYTQVTEATTGERNEIFNIDGINLSAVNVSNGTIYAITYNPDNINDEVIEIYTAVSNLKSYGPYNKVFEYYVNSDNQLTVRFGDGVNGATLPENQTLAVCYIVNNGTNGEVSLAAMQNGSAVGVSEFQKLNTSSEQSNTINKAIEKFAYENFDTTLINKINCSLLSYLVSSNNTSDSYAPRMDVTFMPLSESTKFIPIETIDEVRVNAPKFIRSNDRIITKNDLETVISRDYGNYIYETAIMNNYEYMSSFYKWLYAYDSMTKDIASIGYKYSDSCNFNDIYVFLKGYNKLNINEYTKKNIERAIRDKKILTTEMIFLDAISTFFYPYVGDIKEDLDWLLYAANKYRFLIKSNDNSDAFYVKYNRIMNMFDKDSSGNIIRKANKTIINYILSGESNELKIAVNIMRDSNINKNSSTLLNSVLNCINNTFKVKNCHMGTGILLNDLNDEINDIAGIRYLKTTKSRNVNVYAATSPILSDFTMQYTNITGETTMLANTYFDTEAAFPGYPTTAYFDFTLDESSYKSLGLTGKDEGSSIIATDYTRKFYIQDAVTGTKMELFPVNVTNTEADPKEAVDGINTYRVYIKAASTAGTTGSNNTNSIFSYAGGPREDYNKVFFIWSECTRTDNTDIKAYSNKIRYENTKFTADNIPSDFIISTFIDDGVDTGFDDKDVIENSSLVLVGSEPNWELQDSVNNLSFAKFTNTAINGKDFEYIGAGYVELEQFCFPTLYKDVDSIITVDDSLNKTVTLTY